MTTKTTYGSIDDVKYPGRPQVGGLVYLLDKDPMKLSEKYDEIRAEKTILSAYSIKDQHCLVVFVHGKIKIRRIRNGNTSAN